MESTAELAAIDTASLREPVRALLRNAGAEVLSWRADALQEGTGDHVFRVCGAARSDRGDASWSLVLKLVPGADAAPPGGRRKSGGSQGSGHASRHAWWRNEALAYRSGLLTQLHGDLVAARCYGSVDRPSGAIWLWLEDVVENDSGGWPLERHALAARHLGLFNGAFPEDATGARAAGWLRPREEHGPASGEAWTPAVYPWLKRGWLRAFVERDGWGGDYRAVLGDPATWRHPLMRRAYPTPVAERLLRLHAGRDALLDALDRLPHALCHLDACRRNLFARVTGSGSSRRQQTVAIDWASIGFASLGEETGKLAATNVLLLEVPCERGEALLQAAQECYLDGLAECGWRVDAAMVRAVRYAACVAAALHWASTSAAVPYLNVERGTERGITWMRRWLGCAPPELLERWAPLTYWLLDLGEEAQALVASL